VLLSLGIGLTTSGTACVELQPFAAVVILYDTDTGAVVLLERLSLIVPLPFTGPAGVMPATVALDHVKVEPTVALVGE
jgi:hypothetical protein